MLWSSVDHSNVKPGLFPFPWVLWSPGGEQRRSWHSHICPFVKTGPFCSWAKWLCCEPSELPQISQPLHRFMRIRLTQTTSLHQKRQNEQLIVPTVQQLNDEIIRLIMTNINMNLLLHTYLYLGFCFSSSCQNLKNPIIYRRNWLKDLFETAIWKSRDFRVSSMDPEMFMAHHYKSIKDMEMRQKLKDTHTNTHLWFFWQMALFCCAKVKKKTHFRPLAINGFILAFPS